MELSDYEASEIPEIMAKAFFIARSGRPGPVLVDITKKQFDNLISVIKMYKFSYNPKPTLNIEKVKSCGINQ
jgi:acetolactate synthase-1/2/3 large subunit